MGNVRPTQAQRILDYMEEFGAITQFDALRDLGVMRLASRISELRKNGHKIKSETATVTNRFGEKCTVKRYSILEEKRDADETHL